MLRSLSYLVLLLLHSLWCTSVFASKLETVTTTIVQGATQATSVYVDNVRHVLYFGAARSLGRVTLGENCGNVPLVSQIAAGVKGQIGSQDGVGSAARFADIHGMDGTADGMTLYCADYHNYVIRKVSISRAGGGDGAVFNVTTIAGSTAGSLLDGVGRAARLAPIGLALNKAESALYIGDSDNAAIRRINLSTMLVETLVKNSSATPMLVPAFLQLTPDGQFVIFADTDIQRIARVSSTMGSATTMENIAGALGQSGVLDGMNGLSARFSSPRGLALSPDWIDAVRW
ncbi:Hypothetical protein, putative [Bodo saltans]|uniref:Membrane-associated protein n=1 Tax=Bodo saltans TaxID=75058 RepID=A0A0S4J435_BODSA|nr:Hypothetical protein, putative [Bodo saltans]|eukprot:CUG42967.1 Hypothetical protein, putative [Bodo saltans]